MNQFNQAPVFIFQMGKVGSSSIRTTLFDNHYKGKIIHAHNYRGMTTDVQKLLNEHKECNLPLNIICPVREPISRNISAFFHNFKRDTGYELTTKVWTMDELTTLFLQSCRHNVVLEWFDKNMRTTFDFNIFSQPFPIEKKWDSYQVGSTRILVYRTDLNRTEQLKVISDFLSHQLKNWTYTNEAKNKEYAKQYNNFCLSTKLPHIYTKIILDSQFSQHFWSNQEITSFFKRWN